MRERRKLSPPPNPAMISSTFQPAQNRCLVVLLITFVFAAPVWSEQATRVNSAPAPQVLTLEPPNWWTAFTPELMLLLRGSNFQGARAQAEYRGIQVSRTQASANGDYLFVWLKIRPDASPGEVRLRISGRAGSVTAYFPLLARAPGQGRFQGFAPDDVIYLIMPDRFADGDPGNDQPPRSTGTYDRSLPKAYHGGDLRGIREHLSYLHDLGVTTLWLTPIWKNTDSDYHGYHVVDFYAIDDHMGSLREYQDLVADAHKLGMKVLIDFVANHTGPKHPWATDPPTPQWLHGTPEKHLDPVYEFSGLVDPHATPRQYRRTLEGWFAGKLPDLNPDDPLLAEYLLENARWWTETAGLDGFRLDTFPYSSRRFWSGWHQGIFRTYPHITSIGEVYDSDPTLTSFFQGGRTQFDGVDSRVSTVFDFPMYFALREVVLRGQPVQKILDVLQRDWLYPRPDLLVTFIGNHDTRRFMGEEGSSKERLKAVFSLLMTLRGIPQIYAGDEIGMSGGDDPDNRHDFPGGFPRDARNAFTAAGRTQDEEEVFAHVQSLLRLRQMHPALRHGRQWHIGWDDSYYAFVRETAGEKLLVIYNNAPTPRGLQLPIEDTPLDGARQLETLYGGGRAQLKDNILETTLPPMSLAVYAVR
jgi:neopullulanase